MSIKFYQVIDLLEQMAPLSIAESWDNVGLLIGDNQCVINKVLIALNATELVADEAIAIGANCIITHHPLIYEKLDRITTDTPKGRLLIKLIQNGISVYAAHTNLDIANGGTNDIFANMLHLTNISSLCQEDILGYSLGRTGILNDKPSLREFAKTIKSVINLPQISFFGEPHKIIEKVAIVTGSGGSSKYFLAAKNKNCDVLVTSDIKYHSAQEALEMGLCLIDATHYGSEAPFVDMIKDYIVKTFPVLEVCVSKSDIEIINYV